MSKEKYIGEAPLKDKPGKKLTLVIKDGSVTTPKIADENITTEKVANEAVTTSKIAKQAVTDSKLGDSAVVERTINEGAVTTPKIASGAVETDKIANENVTNEKLAGDSVTTSKIKNEAVTTEKLAESSVEESKIKDGAVTNDKIAQNTLTKDKFDPELRKALDAATGLPDELVTMIQNVDKNLNKLNDTVYPIVLGFTINPNVSTMKTDVVYSVKSDNEYLVPDTLSITKKVNDTAETILTNYPTSNSSLITPIQGAREIFKFAVTKEGRTSQSVSQTKYLCYYGGNAESTITAEILNTLSRVSTTGVSFNPKVTTKDNDYIWLVVPSYLSIANVTSAGFNVTLAAPQTITNNLGSFKAYRTANPLTAATWNLVIS
jgi:hypothetical protein